mmetsp:Transcript_51544/g.95354  ORF Transcript_51544/g.95354 Transcript_51544/m.95354 type:complete len:281 (+) Transcript_51544:45-887(+)
MISPSTAHPTLLCSARGVALGPHCGPVVRPMHLMPQRRRDSVIARLSAGSNCASAALAWFNNVRVPAALLATAAMRMLFISEGKGKGRLQGALRAFYMIAMSVTVVAELSIVFVATLGASRVLTTDVLPAPTSMMCLMTNFELEYLTCRALMLLGAISLLWGLAVRILLAVKEPDVPRVERRSLQAAAILLFAVPLAYIGYSDANAPTQLSSTIPGLQNYAAMVRRSMALLARHLLQSCWGCAAMLLMAGAAGYVAAAVGEVLQPIWLRVRKCLDWLRSD